jgi:hypothetical protein
MFRRAKALLANPVMSSGHAALVVIFADRCEAEMLRLDLCWMMPPLSTSFTMASQS